MLIMCEVVSNECETLPPPPSQFLSPKEKRKGGGGGHWLFNSKQTFSKGADCSEAWYFLTILFKAPLTFRTKSKGPKIS